MSDWQPAIIVPMAGHCAPLAATAHRAPQYKWKMVKVRVRIAEDRSQFYICGAKEFFEIHPEDSAKFWPNSGARIYVCEHKVQTD